MESLKSLIVKMERRSIWDFRLGEASGSIISFECGEKIKCEEVKNDIRKYEGEYSVMIYCSWRICNANKIITSWKDEISLLKKGALKLENLKIVSVNISDSFDLLLEFENGFSLQVFCDEGINSSFDCNWFFRDGHTYYSVNNNSEVEIE